MPHPGALATLLVFTHGLIFFAGMIVHNLNIPNRKSRPYQGRRNQRRQW